MRDVAPGTTGHVTGDQAGEDGDRNGADCPHYSAVVSAVVSAGVRTGAVEPLLATREGAAV